MADFHTHCPDCEERWTDCHCDDEVDEPLPLYSSGDYSADLYHGIEG